MEENIDRLDNQKCPICGTNNLTLMEQEKEIPYFGVVYLFSMTCSNCKYHKADLECVEEHEPAKYSLEIDSEELLNVRIVKSAQATVKIPRIITMEPGPSSNGYVTNVEGILSRVKEILEKSREQEEDSAKKKKIKNMIKKIQKTIWGQDKLKIIVEDPSGNSVIISDKAVKSKL